MDNWTDELLELMSGKLVERKQREKRVLNGESEPQEVSEEVFRQQSSNLVEVKDGSKHR